MGQLLQYPTKSSIVLCPKPDTHQFFKQVLSAPQHVHVQVQRTFTLEQFTEPHMDSTGIALLLL